MNNYLYIISLRYCPFCINTRRLLEENNIKHHDNIIKDEEKFKYKTQEISTFPQIYYVKNKLEKKVLIGGNSDLEDIIDLNNEVVLFPNPSQGFVNIKLVSLNKKIKRVRIIDVNGRVITEHNPKHTNSLKLNTNTLENGIYLIQITTSDNKVLRYKRIVVARQY